MTNRYTGQELAELVTSDREAFLSFVLNETQVRVSSHPPFDGATSLLRLTWGAWVYGMETMNGGLYQFFGNAGDTVPDLVAECLSALEQLELAADADVLRRAHKAYVAEDMDALAAMDSTYFGGQLVIEALTDFLAERTEELAADFAASAG